MQSQITAIATTVYLVGLLIFMGSMLLCALRHHWIMSLVRLGITLLSAAVAIPATNGITAALSGALYDGIESHLPGGMNEWLRTVPAVGDGARAFVSLCAAPLLYPLVFLLLRFILTIICHIVEKVTKISKNKPSYNRAISLPVGALHGALIAFVLAIPLCGFIMTGARAVDAFLEAEETRQAEPSEQEPSEQELYEEDGDGDLIRPEEVEPYIEMCQNHFTVKSVYAVGRPVYRALTSRRFTSDVGLKREERQRFKISLEDELCGLGRAAGRGMAVAERFGEVFSSSGGRNGDDPERANAGRPERAERFTEEDKRLLIDAADSFFASDWISRVCADSLAALSVRWLRGEPFAGIRRPGEEMDEVFVPTVDQILYILSIETPETLKEDLRTILDVVGDLLTCDLFNSDLGYEKMVRQLGEQGMLSQLLEKLQGNERLRMLASELQALGVRCVSRMLGIDQLQSGEYAELMGKVAGSLDEVAALPEAERSEKIMTVVQDIQRQFGAEEYEIPESVVNEVANKAIEDLGGDGQITQDELTAYLVEKAEKGFELPEGFELPALPDQWAGEGNWPEPDQGMPDQWMPDQGKEP